MRVVVKMYVYTSIVLLCAAVLTSYGKMVRRWHGVDRQWSDYLCVRSECEWCRSISWCLHIWLLQFSVLVQKCCIVPQKL